jgi:serine/threonine-protein kinase
MPRTNADRSLLFGLMAARLDLVDTDKLADALTTWASGKTRPLGEILVERGHLTPERSALLESMVREHLGTHGADPGVSRTAVLPDPPGEDATNVDAQASVRWETVAPAPRDPDATQPPSSAPSPFSATGDTIVPPDSGPADDFKTQPHASQAGPGPGRVPTPAATSSERFRVVRPHARGGLGEVLVAADQELRREVALKRIQDRYADDDESRGRFLLEAEITGALEHPGIVPVYSLGVYPDGRLYYAMRFIRGDSLKEAIDRYYDKVPGLEAPARSLELRSLLGRFVAVCNAMAYAHSRGILHRDLKPANVMLGAYGETLVVDWGLAKPVGTKGVKSSSPEGALNPSLSSISMPTVMGSAVGTPQFMSPEQAGGRLDQLGPATDIYSLGATLFYLLAGKASVDGANLPEVLEKVQRGDIQSTRDINPSVPRPLEAICRKAMALKPEDRYASAADLATDVEHWLADEPVSAWREPWYVRAQRWVSRNRTLVTGVASAVLVALVGLGVSTVLLNAANGRERAARAAAEDNYRMARQAVDRYHTNVSEDILLNEPGLQPLRRRLLEDAREFYERFIEGHEDDPGVQAEMGQALYRLAQITGDIDSPHRAIELHTKARAIFARLDDSAALAACDHHLGRLYRLTDDLARAEDFGARAVAGWEALHREHPDEPRYEAELARSRNVLANVYQVRRDLPRAVEADGLALAAWEKLVARDRGNAEYRRYLALSHNHLGMVYNDLGDVKKAEEAFGQSLAVRQELARDYPNVSQYRHDLATTHFNLGDLYTQAGQRKRAVGPFTEAAAIWKELTERHPAVSRYQTNLAETYSVLAGTYLAARDLDKAEAAARDALAIRQRLANAQPDVPAYQAALADGHFRLGDVHRQRRQREKAEAAYREALRIQEPLASAPDALPLYRADAARSHNNLGLFYQDERKWAEAEASFRGALPYWEALVAAHPREVEYPLGLSATCYNLGNVRADNGTPADSLEWYGRAVRALDDRFPPEQHSAAIKRALSDALKERAEALTRLGRYKDALPDWERAVSLAAAANRPWFQISQARTLALSGDHAAASARVAELAPKASRSGEACFLLAGVCSLASAAAAADGAPPAAERHAARAVELLRSARAVNFFAAPGNVARLADSPDFAAVRGRPEVVALLKELRPKGKP